MKLLIVALVFLGFHHSALSSEKTNLDKCNNPIFIDQAQRFFTCENSWDIISCSSLNVFEVGAIGAASSKLAGKAETAIEKKLKVSSSNKLSSALGMYEHYMKREKVDSKILEDLSQKVKNKDGLRKYFLFRGTDRNVFVNLITADPNFQNKSPEEIAKFVDEVRSYQKTLGQHQANVEKTADEINKILRSSSLTSENEKAVRKAMMSWRDHVHFSANENVKFLWNQNDLSLERNKYTSRGEAAIKSVDLQNEFRNRFQGKSLIRGTIIGAIPALILAKGAENIPEAKKYILSHQCTDQKNQKNLLSYLDIQMGFNNCITSLSDVGELDLLLKTPEDRQQLFAKHPILCDALVKKQEARFEQFKALNITSTPFECSKGSLKTSIKIGPRTYYYDVEKANGKLEITSQLGHRSFKDFPSHVKPKTIKWNYDPDKERFSDPEADVDNLLTKAAGASPLPENNLDFLGKAYGVIVPQYQPILLSSKEYKSSVMDKNQVTGTVAEQSIALKFGLLDAISKCQDFQNSNNDVKNSSIRQAK